MKLFNCLSASSPLWPLCKALPSIRSGISLFKSTFKHSRRARSVQPYKSGFISRINYVYKFPTLLWMRIASI